MNEKPKVSFIVCGVHVAWPDGLGRPWIDERMVEKCRQSLKDAGMEVVEVPRIVSKRPQSFAAVQKSLEEDVDCIIFYAATWLWASEMTQASRIANRPIIVWTPPISQGWATGGALVLHGALDEIGVKHKLVYGFPDDLETMKKIVAFVKAAEVVRKLSTARLGLVGGRSMGVSVGAIDEAQWMEKFGLDVEHIDQYMVFREAEQLSEAEVKKKYNELSKTLGEVPPFDQVMNRSIRIYLAMKKLIADYKLDMVAFKCFPEIGDYYATACLSQSLLNDEGFTSGCVGDLNTTLTAYVLGQFTGRPVFNPDVQQVKKEDRLVKLVADGSAAPSLAEALTEVKLARRGVFGEGNADGICLGLVCKPGFVTLTRLFRIRGRYFMHIAQGEAYLPSNLKEAMDECGFPNWPHAFVKLRGDPDAFMQNQRSEYISMSYGDVRDELVDLCYLLDIELIETK